MSQELFDAHEAVGPVGRRRRARRAQPPHARARRRAAALVATARVPCGRELASARRRQPEPGAAPHDRSPATSPRGRRASQASADFVGVAFHGMAASHIDALCHVFVDGQMYNGVPGDRSHEHRRPAQLIESARDGIVGAACCSTYRACAAWTGSSPATRSPDELDAAWRARRRGRAGRHPARAHRPRRAARGARPVEPEPRVWPGSTPSASRGCASADPSVLGCDGVSDALPAELAPVADAHAPMPARRHGRAPARQPAPRPRWPTPAPSAERWEFLFVVRRCGSEAGPDRRSIRSRSL